MNKTEQNGTTASEKQRISAFEREHTMPASPPSSEKTGKLPKSVVAVVVGCLVLNLLMMTTVAVLYVVRRNQDRAAALAMEEMSVDEHADEVYVEDNSLGGIWLPKDSSLAKNQLKDELFHETDGWITYEGASLGIDVSEFQTVTDWDAVKRAGVDFVMVRVGRRGYESGQICEDVSYRQNIEGAQKAGLSVGVYFFSQAVTPNEAREEARYVLDCIKEYDITYPVAFDWESVEETQARTFEMRNDQLNAIARAFSDTIKEAGYRPMLYFYKHLGYRQYVLDNFSDCEFWLSEPGDGPTFYYAFSMWQYTVNGSVPGVEGTVDMNLCFTPYM